MPTGEQRSPRMERDTRTGGTDASLDACTSRKLDFSPPEESRGRLPLERVEQKVLKPSDEARCMFFVCLGRAQMKAEKTDTMPESVDQLCFCSCVAVSHETKYVLDAVNNEILCASHRLRKAIELCACFLACCVA